VVDVERAAGHVEIAVAEVAKEAFWLEEPRQELLTAAWQALGRADDAFPVLKLIDPPVILTVPSKTTLPLKIRLVPAPTASVLQSTQLLPVTVTVPVGTLQFLVAVHRAKEVLTGWPLVRRRR